jgi:hypothetical protein
MDPSSAVMTWDVGNAGARSTKSRCPSVARPEYTTLYQQNVDVADKTLDVMSLPLAAGNALDLAMIASHLTMAPGMAFITLS